MKAFIILLSITISMAVHADIQITISDSAQKLSTVSSNGSRARLDNSGQAEYVLIDFASELYMMVEPQRRQVLNMDATKTSPASNAIDSKLDIKLLSKGKGPTIAGYATTRYELMANAKQCATIYASREVLELDGVSKLFDAMVKMQQQTQKMLGAMRSQLDACAQANLQLPKHFRSAGAPLRVLDENGKIETEVMRIDTNKKIAQNYYDVPANFKSVSVADKMHQMGEQSRQMQDKIPEMNQIMQQLQQGGQMTPEMIEQMKKMQEMLLQQYQQ